MKRNNENNEIYNETTQLLRSDLSLRYNNYQSYSDLCLKSLGSLNLLTITEKKNQIITKYEFKKNIYLYIHIFKEIDDYLDSYSKYSFKCTSKSIKTALELSKNYIPPSNQSNNLNNPHENNENNENQNLYRIEPLNFMNKLRGIVSDSILSQQISNIPDDLECERLTGINNNNNNTNNSNDNRDRIDNTIPTSIIYWILVSLIIGFLIYLFKQMI